MPTPRVKLDKQNPDIYKQFVATSVAVAAAAAAAGLDRRVVELVNLRCSQLNGCAFCLSLHHEDAITAGVTEQQIAVLPAWREAPYLYDDQTRAALELAETVTELPGPGDANCAYERAADILDAAQIAAVTWASITMNAFNRVSIMSEYNVRPR
ncbi:carboxymuconolactone decarboxylase family protein [Gordonia liuliyuniae]|uniref:Carboxymuconolactone decarboxylase family protein n=1 Tax=Gordonia liuliyuniae TaxID=2911517 RepID=A0ABS9IQD3_9ACTN|nr:carboxymuconolactone decarboxylase family protein [Gordonia liuliyuniae]MCF8587763.1 carboxymuconolactone decarboxylase family protein [Gordonia liuliyuniae]